VKTLFPLPISAVRRSRREGQLRSDAVKGSPTGRSPLPECPRPAPPAPLPAPPRIRPVSPPAPLTSSSGRAGDKAKKPPNSNYISISLWGVLPGLPRPRRGSIQPHRRQCRQCPPTHTQSGPSLPGSGDPYRVNVGGHDVRTGPLTYWTPFQLQLCRLYFEYRAQLGYDLRPRIARALLQPAHIGAITSAPLLVGGQRTIRTTIHVEQKQRLRDNLSRSC
jgi:hypothetical protein